jgi:hypothetical protein
MNLDFFIIFRSHKSDKSNTKPMLGLIAPTLHVHQHTWEPKRERSTFWRFNSRENASDTEALLRSAIVEPKRPTRQQMPGKQFRRINILWRIVR